MSDTLIAVILGLVEGITEYLPVSSTGHLILFGEALQFTGEKAKSFDVIIQVGAILSVVVLFWHRFAGLFDGMFNFKNVTGPGLRGSAGLFKLAVVTFPALVIGLLLHHKIKEHLFAPIPVAIALAFGGVIMIAIEKFLGDRGGKEADSLSWKQCLAIGFIQCIAMWPGMSRSASVIIGGMLLGLNRKAAAEFSFLAAVPVLSAAALFDFVKAFPTLSAGDAEILAIGFLVSFVTAWITVKWFITLVMKHSLIPFGIYRIIVAALVLWLVHSPAVAVQ